MHFLLQKDHYHNGTDLAIFNRKNPAMGSEIAQFTVFPEYVKCCFLLCCYGKKPIVRGMKQCLVIFELMLRVAKISRATPQGFNQHILNNDSCYLSQSYGPTAPRIVMNGVMGPLINGLKMKLVTGFLSPL